MKIYVPQYYKDFQCIAEKCRHNCCIGWEIDIDSTTYEKYMNVKGNFGKKLKSCIVNDDMAHFALDKQERCPFLNSCNLCEIIDNLGEDYLCQICDDHPRYRNFFYSREEIGLGLCCEEAARIILTRKDKFNLVPMNNEIEVIDKKDREFFLERDMVLSVLQQREINLGDRIKNLNINLPNLTLKELKYFFSSMERLDCVWDKYLMYLDLTDDFKNDIFEDDLWQRAFEQLIIYFIYRHMAEHGSLAIAFAILSAKLISGICYGFFKENNCISIENLIEFSRAYSSEIEYSDENTDKIFDLLKNSDSI